ncbi:hypothetical protein N9B69_01210 [Amylibacter sp.]|nr:hypothetical protein [Amylibacter sp.]
MGDSQRVPELVATAKTAAKVSTDRIAEIVKRMDGQGGPSSEDEDLRAATVALELASVDIFSLFEARMQHHFRRGPFSRKLKTLLLEAKQSDLADRFHQYYLAINVLKHGKGASYRELLNAPNAFVVVKPVQDMADETRTTSGLVDVNVAGFFDGLTDTILEAYEFLENR